MKILKQTFNRLVRFVASLDFSTTVCVTAATGCMLVLYGGVYEAKAQLDLLHRAGRVALDAYLTHVTAHRLPLAAFMMESLTGRCEAYGAFLRGAGFWGVLVLPPLVAVLVLLARCNVKTRSQTLA